MSWLFVDALSICISVQHQRCQRSRFQTRRNFTFSFFWKPGQYLLLEFESIETQFLRKGSGQSIHCLVQYLLPRYSENRDSIGEKGDKNYGEKLIFSENVKGLAELHVPLFTTTTIGRLQSVKEGCPPGIQPFLKDGSSIILAYKVSLG